MRAVSLGILVACLAARSAAAEPAKHWVPLDRITMGATGDLTLTGDQLAFGSDGSIHVHLLKAHIRGRWSEANTVEDADVYRVDPPARPSSARGDVLCDVPATYIVLSRPVSSDLDMSVYTDPVPPRGDGSDKACATFSYTQD